LRKEKKANKKAILLLFKLKLRPEWLGLTTWWTTIWTKPRLS